MPNKKSPVESLSSLHRDWRDLHFQVSNQERLFQYQDAFQRFQAQLSWRALIGLQQCEPH